MDGSGNISVLILTLTSRLMHGDPNGAFRPFDTIRKQEFMAVLVRMIVNSYLKENTEPRYAAYEKVSKDLGVITKDIDPANVGLVRHDAALMLFRAYKYQQFGLVTKG